MEPYIGEIRIFAGNFAPENWQFCHGQLVSISDYDALFSLIGTSYGGNGTTTFGLPNLSSRVVVGQGQLPGGSNYPMAQPLGVENVTLNSAQLATHAHPFAGTLGVVPDGDRPIINPTGSFFGGGGASAYSTELGASPGTLGSGAIVGQSSAAGGAQPHPNIGPVQALNYIISMNGIYPSQP